MAAPQGAGANAAIRVGAWLGLALAGVPALGGCLPPQASYGFGFTTTEVVGDLDVEEPETAGDPLILVYKYHYVFMGLEEGKGTGMGEAPDTSSAPFMHVDRSNELTHPTASLAPVRPHGSFTIYLPNDVVRLAVFFISPDRLTEVFQFDKQLGVGRIVYHAKLPRMADWRSHFYTYLMPELEHVIVEPRYQLPLPDQAYLSAWLSTQRKRLEAMRTTPPDKS